MAEHVPMNPRRCTRRPEGETPLQFAKGDAIAIGEVVTRANVMRASSLLARIRSTQFGQRLDYGLGALSTRDIAVLKFLSAVESIESDVWRQYEELAGVKHGAQDPYRLALQSLDDSASHYVTSCTRDEISHSTYLNSYLESEGIDPIDLDRFRILQGSRASGSLRVGRLTNLMHLNLDITYTRQPARESDSADVYSSSKEMRVFNLASIPTADVDLEDASEVRALARTAALHFGYFEGLVTNLYAYFTHSIRRVKVLGIVLGIAGNELAHFLDSANLVNNAQFEMPWRMEGSPVCDSDQTDDPSFTRNVSDCRIPPCSQASSAIMGESAGGGGVPCKGAWLGAVGTIRSLWENGLFAGQIPAFTRAILSMAEEADRAATE